MERNTSKWNPSKSTPKCPPHNNTQGSPGRVDGEDGGAKSIEHLHCPRAVCQTHHGAVSGPCHPPPGWERVNMYCIMREDEDALLMKNG